MTHFSKFSPNHIFVMGEARHFKFRVMIDTEKCNCMHDVLIFTLKGRCSESRNLFNFLEISDVIISR